MIISKNQRNVIDISFLAIKKSRIKLHFKTHFTLKINKIGIKSFWLKKKLNSHVLKPHFCLI